MREGNIPQMNTDKHGSSIKSRLSVFIRVHLWSISVLLFAALILLLSTAGVVFAQCAMCKANISNAENVTDVSQRINSAVLVLLIPTLVIIGGIIRLVYQYRDHHHETYVNDRTSGSQRHSE
jgi:hypothetical protein